MRLTTQNFLEYVLIKIKDSNIISTAYHRKYPDLHRNKYTPQSDLKPIHFTRFQPFINLVWNREKSSNKIVILRNKTIRVINNLKFSSPANHYVKNMNILELADQSNL